MSGLKYLVDTNFVLAILKGQPDVMDMIAAQQVWPLQCGYSFITRLELLSYSEITLLEKKKITALLSEMTYLGWSHVIEEETIKLKQKNKLKLPDAMILGTAHVHGLELFSLDKQLLSRARALQ